MYKNKSLTVIDRNHGPVMTDEGLLIPGRLLRKMGEEIAVSFSPQLIVISSRPSSARKRKPEKAASRSQTAETVKRKMRESPE